MRSDDFWVVYNHERHGISYNVGPIRFEFEIRSVNNLSSSEDCSTDYCQVSTSLKTAMAETTMLTINYL